MNNNIYQRVFDFIKANSLLSPGDRVLLALSAGKDSMMLLNIFLLIRSDIPIEIGIFHLNHMMRGKESDDDEKFVAGIAAANGLPFFSERFDFANEKPEGFSFEEYAREKRYELLAKICSEHNYRKIATAHNRDDNIETILMRIFTGTGIHGLRGIEAMRGNIIRPLLFLSSGEIYDYLAENGIDWREDSSNKDNKYTRNFVRNSLMPAVKERFKEADNAILSLSETAGDYTELIDELIGQGHAHIHIIEESVILERDNIINNKRLFNYVTAKIIRENFGGFVTRNLIEEIYKKAVTGRTNMLLYENSCFSVKKCLKNGKKIIAFSKNTDYNNNWVDWNYKIDLNINKNEIYIKEIDKKIFCEFVDYDYFLTHKGSNGIIFISTDEEILEADIRSRRNGDRIKLDHGSRKIKELMIDSKLDNSVKNSIPLLVVDSRVAAFMASFVTGLRDRVSADFYVKSDSKKILAISTGK